EPNKNFKLGQNFPNPFNPATTISYELPRRAHVTLEVFDLMGKRVARLVEGIQREGRHEITWNATAHASGIYWYRLRSGEEVLTKKMVLLR
ncbi:MAG: T9SS type A sorting domain-containing protein, partial [candidate division KSB1 bacterium]